jgi:fucose 4-O-acetylase-like acetyltransferase
MEQKTAQRIEWIDIARGMAMLIVVIGHSGASWVNPYISWVQMPLFFFIGGLVFKNAKDKKAGNVAWSLHKVRLMIVPYIVFGALTYFVFRELNPALLPSKQNLLFGGIRLQGIYGVYWFITVYLATILVFNLISQLKKKEHQLIVVGAMYVLGHVLFMTSDTVTPIVWNLDVVLISTAYFAMGYYLKSYVDLLGKIVPVAIAGGTIVDVFYASSQWRDRS